MLSVPPSLCSAPVHSLAKCLPKVLCTKCLYHLLTSLVSSPVSHPIYRNDLASEISLALLQQYSSRFTTTQGVQALLTHAIAFTRSGLYAMPLVSTAHSADERSPPLTPAPSNLQELSPPIIAMHAHWQWHTLPNIQPRPAQALARHHTLGRRWYMIYRLVAMQN